MTKRVLNVGHCVPDHVAIRAYLRRHFDCEVTAADGLDDTLPLLRGGLVDLVLVNRKIDRDYSDGVEVIRFLKANPRTADVPVMLVTNYANHQDEAVAAGALRGFGKIELDNAETLEKLAAVLGEGASEVRTTPRC
jgi:two-component system chemotaxis response regulator CheY